MKNINTFSALFKEKRLEKKISFKDLGAQIKIAPSVLFKYEHGLLYPRLSTLERICIFFSLDFNNTLKLITSEREKSLSLPSRLDILAASNAKDCMVGRQIVNLPSEYKSRIQGVTGFKIGGEFLRPKFHQGQIILVVNCLPPEIEPEIKDYVIIRIECSDGKYSSSLEVFKKATKQWDGIVVKDGIDFIAGQLVSKTEDIWELCGINNKRSSIKIDVIDIEQSQAIIGVLF